MLLENSAICDLPESVTDPQKQMEHNEIGKICFFMYKTVLLTLNPQQLSPFTFNCVFFTEGTPHHQWPSEPEINAAEGLMTLHESAPPLLTLPESAPLSKPQSSGQPEKNKKVDCKY